MHAYMVKLLADARIDEMLASAERNRVHLSPAANEAQLRKRDRPPTAPPADPTHQPSMSRRERTWTLTETTTAKTSMKKISNRHTQVGPEVAVDAQHANVLINFDATNPF